LDFIKKEISLLVTEFRMDAQDVIHVSGRTFRETLILNIDADDLFPRNTLEDQCTDVIIQERGLSCPSESGEHIIPLRFKRISAPV